MNTNDNLFKSAGDVYNKLRTIDSCSFNYTNLSPLIYLCGSPPHYHLNVSDRGNIFNYYHTL